MGEIFGIIFVDRGSGETECDWDSGWGGIMLGSGRLGLFVDWVDGRE